MTQDPEPKKEKNKDRVRSAWISFVGRIVAQLVGAVATVSLGVMVLHRYSGPERQVPLQPAPPSVTVVFISAIPSTTTGIDGPLLPAAEIAAQQAQMARAIVNAMSSRMPPGN